MNKLLLLLGLIVSLSCPPASIADATQSTAATGTYGNTSYATGTGPNGVVTTLKALTGKGSACGMPTTYGLLTTGASKGLPPTSLDGFVRQAGGAAQLIYGDEGGGLPPYFGFDMSHRIGNTLPGGLTTYHGSVMPSSWGYTGEFNMSGPQAPAPTTTQVLKNSAPTTFSTNPLGTVLPTTPYDLGTVTP